jgi:ketosteroid isomerase-like protein
MSVTEEKLALAAKFHAAPVAADRPGTRELFTADATWTLPGENTVSGTASGPDEVIERARKIAGYGLALRLRAHPAQPGQSRPFLAQHGKSKRPDPG